MTKRVDAEASCGHCWTKFQAQLYRVVWAETPGLKASVFDDTINMIRCPTCGTTTRALLAMMYVDKRRSLAVWYEPSPDPSIDRELQDYEMVFGPGNFYNTAPRLRNWREFKEAILRLEGPAAPPEPPGAGAAQVLAANIEKLTPDRAWSVHFAIISYGFLRTLVGEGLLKPFLSSLSAELSPARPTIPDASLHAQLMDEVLLAFLRCCQRPERWGLPYSPDRYVQLMGLFALADKGDHHGSSKPDALTGFQYSDDPNTAKDQLMLAWLKLLGVGNAEAGRRALGSSFLNNWEPMIKRFVGEIVSSTASNFSPEQALSVGRQLVQDLPPHRRRIVEDLVIELTQGNPQGTEAEVRGAGDGDSPEVPPEIEDDIRW